MVSCHFLCSTIGVPFVNSPQGSSLAQEPTEVLSCPVPSASKKVGEATGWYQHHALSVYSSCPWCPSRVEKWVLALHETSFPKSGNVSLIPKSKRHLVFSAPPPHLFMNFGSVEKCYSAFFIRVCIRRTWLGCVYCQQGLNSPESALTSAQWEDILSGVYWKAQIIPCGESTEMCPSCGHEGPMGWSVLSELIGLTTEQDTNSLSPLHMTLATKLANQLVRPSHYPCRCCGNSRYV